MNPRLVQKCVECSICSTFSVHINLIHLFPQQELAQGIIRLQQRDVVHKATDRVMSRADFYAFCRTNLPSENILRVVETTLLQEGSISVGKSTSDLEVKE